MATYTTNLNLEKPVGNENFNRQVLNDNLDKIDMAVAAHTSDTATAHGATSAAAASKIILRDANGRAKVASPSTSDDIARKDTVDAVQTNLTTHLVDYIRQPGFAVDSGVANVYVITLTPAPTSYVDGMGISIKITNTNTGASTINVNSLGAKMIVDSKGNTLTSGKVKMGSIYSLKYNSTTGNFILQGEGGEYGTATAAQVLSGYTIGMDSGIISGSMPYNGAVTIVPGIYNQIIAAGYHNGNGYVVGDTNLIAGNILSSKSIFGVSGTAVRAAKGNATADGSGIITVTGLAFTPTAVTIQGSRFTYPYFYVRSIANIGQGVGLDREMVAYSLYAGNSAASISTTVLASGSGLTLDSSGFHCSGFEAGTSYAWVAVE